MNGSVPACSPCAWVVRIGVLGAVTNTEAEDAHDSTPAVQSGVCEREEDGVQYAVAGDAGGDGSLRP